MNTLEYLKLERKELSQHIVTLSLFVSISPEYKKLPTNHKRLICSQLEFMKAYLCMIDLRIECIENTINVDVQPVKHGRWIKRKSTSDSIKCSVCGNNYEYDTIYCPHCGARMDGKNNE